MSLSSIGAWLKKQEDTYVGKLVLSFGRAFVGVFVAGIVVLATNAAVTHDWNAAWVALGALVSAGFTAGVKAVQLYLQGKAA